MSSDGYKKRKPNFFERHQLGKNKGHKHVMRNLSTGSDYRYCVAGLWDPKQKEFVNCPYSDNKAHRLG